MITWDHYALIRPTSMNISHLYNQQINYQRSTIWLSEIVVLWHMVGSTGSLQCDVIQLRTFCYTTNKVDFLFFLFYKSEYKNRLRFWEKIWFLFVRMFVWMAICTHIVQLYTLCVQLYSLVCHAMVQSRLAAVWWQYKPVLSSIEKLTSISWKEENS